MEYSFLLICGAYQLFGKYYKGVDGNLIPGLEVFDYYTVANPDRKKEMYWQYCC